MFSRRKVSVLGLALLVVTAVAVTGCGSSSSSKTSGSKTTSSAAPAKSGPAKKVAFLAVFPSNPYVASAFKAAQTEAKKHNMDLTEIGVNSGDPQAEYSAIQDAATKDAYDGYIILPQNGTSDTPAAKQLVKTGKPVVADGIALGPDLCTEKPQIKGMAGAALTPTCQVAKEGFGPATVEACKGLAHCTILWETGLPGFAGETEFLNGVKAAVKGISGAKLIISSPTQYDPNTARNVITNALTAHKDINVVWAQAPQMFLGSVPALKATHSKARIVMDGGTVPQNAALAAGQINGNKVVAAVMGNSIPGSDSVYSVQIMAKALADKSYRGVGINTLKELGLPMVFTKANLSQWKSFKAQWSAGNVQ